MGKEYRKLCIQDHPLATETKYRCHSEYATACATLFRVKETSFLIREFRFESPPSPCPPVTCGNRGREPWAANLPPLRSGGGAGGIGYTVGAVREPPYRRVRPTVPRRLKSPLLEQSPPSRASRRRPTLFPLWRLQSPHIEEPEVGAMHCTSPGNLCRVTDASKAPGQHAINY